jgi:hypothetical protein
VDSIFYKGKYDYQKTIKHVSRMIVSVLDYNAIAKLLTDTVVDTMLVEYCSVFLPDSSKHHFANFSAYAKQVNFDHPNKWRKESALVEFMKTHHQPIIKRKMAKRVLSADKKDVL